MLNKDIIPTGLGFGKGERNAPCKCRVRSCQNVFLEFETRARNSLRIIVLLSITLNEKEVEKCFQKIDLPCFTIEANNPSDYISEHLPAQSKQQNRYKLFFTDFCLFDNIFIVYILLQIAIE